MKITRQGTLVKVSLTSSRTLIVCWGGGWIRSRVLKKEIKRKMSARMANKLMVHTHPWAASPLLKRSTSGSVNP